MRNRIIKAILGDLPFYENGSASRRIQMQTRAALALSRGAATAATRRIDPENPLTWEFCAFSQNGEDGILDYLVSLLEKPTRYFIEIGASNGIENNSAWWAMARRYSGVMVEGSPQLSRQARELYKGVNWGLKCLDLFVEKDNLGKILDAATCHEPDMFTLDIDGNDWYIAEGLFAAGLRPRVVCVEYNSTFGPDRAVTVPYRRGFDRRAMHPSGNYYGVSVRGWRKFFESRDYHFVTVDSNGVNAFFVDRKHFPAELCARWKPLEFRENFALADTTWQQQFEEIKHLELVEV